MLKVAFIDDGIMRDGSECPEQTEHLIIKAGMIVKKKQFIERVSFSHATICFKIFSHYISTRDYKLYDIEILDTDGEPTAMSALECALEFCLKKGVHLINMSLGSTHFHELENDGILYRLYRQGTFMIAANNNGGLLTFPACSDYVIGVKRDYSEVLQKDEFYYGLDEIDHTNIISHCIFDGILKEKEYMLRKANSFSTPYISAVIFKLLRDGLTREQVNEYLMSHSVKNRTVKNIMFRKKEYKNWKEEIDVPMIGVLVETTKDDQTFIDLLQRFRNQDFNAVGLVSGHQYEKFSPYLYSYLGNDIELFSYEEKLLCIFHATNADIIFILYSDSALCPYQKEIDLVVNYSNNIPDLSISVINGNENNIEKTVNEIVDFFNSS